MVEIARHHVGAAAEHGFQRVRAALEVDQFHREAGLVELAELFWPARSADSTGMRHRRPRW